MSYASAQDAIDIYGTEYVTVACDRDRDGQLDTDAFERCLIAASDKIDGYLLGRIPGWPWASVPRVLIQICVDIAIYIAGPTADVATDPKRRLYDDALEWLDNVARGKIKLLHADGTDPGAQLNQSASTLTSSQNRVLMTEHAREMTRHKLRFL